MDPTAVIATMVVLAFLPAVVILAWVRNQEKHGREPVRALAGTFLFGATAGVALAVFLTVLFGMGMPRADVQLGVDKVFLATVVIAPFTEELAKGLGLALPRRLIREPEDGIVYGVAVGLGFAATENLVYAFDALVRGGAEAGFDLAVATLVTRVFSSMLLHAAASGLVGFGYSRVLMRGGVALEVLPYYLAAVLLHAVYNFIVQRQEWLALVLAIFIVVTVFTMLRRHVRTLDAQPGLR